MYHDRDFQGALPGEPKKSRRKLGDALPIHIKDVTLASIQDPIDPILNDGIIRDPNIQTNDPALSPVAVAFWAARGRTASDIYMMASLDDVRRDRARRHPGDVTGFKRIFQITMPSAGGPVVKQEVLDLNNIRTPADNELILVKLAAPLN